MDHASKLKPGIVIKRNGVEYLTTNYDADEGYVSVVCIENTNQRGQTYQLPIEECCIFDESVIVVNRSELEWVIDDIDLEMIEALEGNRDAQLTLSLKQREKFYLPKTLQAMMNIKEEGAEDGEMGVVFFGEQEELFLAELKTVLEIFDELSITDACETGASIFAKSTQLNIQGFIGVNFNGK
ncbi:hypothetical protein P3602_21360 [Vibrio parahaemolyticus]|uniref:hypothetical protein n=1 Tax=Vibrio TaxID=662 RepID=UPI001CDCFF22|nr:MULTISPECIES: hypothetical protein [Vibrio]MDF5108459.1 hypothetical protein [Vibrio parahaemolyticus]MCA2420875.1 hypothetical protein [Vibrio alginolyticus]MCA2445649.1 hypothetical protein [Vibrio alginolyticus]MDF5143364.1 hypothetical protein [Vibrio parahaemolyticus]MDF5153790.1 hypothetical protein [Vibrio parahaemolyticus]